MNRFLKPILIVSFSIAALILAYYAYGAYAVDSTLQNILGSAQMAQEASRAANSAEKHLHRSMTQEIELDALSSAETDLEKIILLRAADQSADAPSALLGEVRASAYLNEVVFLEKKGRSFLGFIKFHIDWFYFYLKKKVEYLIMRIQGGPSSKARFLEKISDEILFNRAKEKEQNGNFDEAAQLYRLYLEKYPDQKETGLVRLALVQTLIKSQKLEEARSDLDKILSGGIYGFEKETAIRLRERIRKIEERKNWIDSLETQIDGEQNPQLRDLSTLQLSKLLLSNYEFDDAAKRLESLKSAQDPEIREQAALYLGIVYRIQKKWDLAENELLELLDEQEIDQTLSLFLRSQLAEVFKEKGDLKRAEQQYGIVSEQAKGMQREDYVRYEIWVGVTSSEVAVLNYELQNFGKMEEQIAELERLGNENPQFLELRNQLKKKNLSEKPKIQAFISLVNGNVIEAVNLFKSVLKANPQDAWAHAGLATCYIIMGEMETAMEFASKGHDLKADEYTTSVLAFVYRVTGNLPQAIRLYEDALIHKRTYVPAQFNLATVLLLAERLDESVALLLSLYEEYQVYANKQMRAKILNNLSVAFAMQGKLVQAAEVIREAVRIDPDLQEARINEALLGEGSKGLEVAESLMAPTEQGFDS